jgi:hypothetical protein
MQIEQALPVILILGIISLYFLITGIRGLMKKSMRVLNPLADRAPSSMTDLFFDVLKKKVETDYNVPENFADKSQMIVIKGRDLYVRAWIHIILGLITVFVLVIFLSPSLLDQILNVILSIS